MILPIQNHARETVGKNKVIGSVFILCLEPRGAPIMFKIIPLDMLDKFDGVAWVEVQI